jgi:hypothetical protein
MNILILTVELLIVKTLGRAVRTNCVVKNLRSITFIWDMVIFAHLGEYSAFDNFISKGLKRGGNQ